MNMKDLKHSCKIAVVQAAPVMFDKAACTDKAVGLIREAGKQGAELIVFPELFIPGYPYGMTYGFTVGSRTPEGRKDWKSYYDNSILVPGPETAALARAAKEAHAYVSIGVSERDSLTATLYNSNIVLSPEGELLTNHRAGGLGGRQPGLFPHCRNPLGPHGQHDLLGELHAPGPGGAVSEGRDPLPLPQHQRQRGMAGHHPAHRHRGTLLLYQL